MIYFKGKKPNKFNRVEFKIGEEFKFMGMTYRCILDDGNDSPFCAKCGLRTCASNIACNPIEREDGRSVQFEIVWKEDEK